MASVIAIVSWRWIPFVMLILLAGLQSLPDSTVEAAHRRRERFRHVPPHHLAAPDALCRDRALARTIFILSEFGIFVTTAGGPDDQPALSDFLGGVLEAERRSGERLSSP